MAKYSDIRLDEIYALEMQDENGINVIAIRDSFDSQMFIVLEDYEELPYTITYYAYGIVQDFENDLVVNAIKIYTSRAGAIKLWNRKVKLMLDK